MSKKSPQSHTPSSTKASGKKTTPSVHRFTPELLRNEVASFGSKTLTLAKKLRKQYPFKPKIHKINLAAFFFNFACDHSGISREDVKNLKSGNFSKVSPEGRKIMTNFVGQMRAFLKAGLKYTGPRVSNLERTLIWQAIALTEKLCKKDLHH